MCPQPATVGRSLGRTRQCRAQARGELSPEDVDMGQNWPVQNGHGGSSGPWRAVGARPCPPLCSQVPFSVSVFEQRLLARVSGLLWAALRVDGLCRM